MAVSAQIQIPLQPVPITLQPTAVMVLGLFFTKRSAVQAVLVYILLGATGMPIFAGYSAGYGILMGPSAGYLLGFILAVYVMTSIKSGPFVSVILGTCSIYFCGVCWLSMSIGFPQAITLGVMPFIIPGFIKSFLLAGIAKFLKS